MIRFKTLTIKNFLSYGAVPTIIDLETVGSTLIVGEDLDNTASGTGANGVGKTVIINALSYVLYDKPISKISLDNLVNNINKKNMEVTIVFEKDKKIYTIKRVRKAKAGSAGNYVQVFEGTKKDITPAGVSNANKLIESILGIPHDLFVRVAAFSATHKPFLDLPLRSQHEANQTGIIEELFGLTTLSEKADLLKKVIKDTEQSLKIQKLKVEHAQKERDRLNNQIKNTISRKENWDISNKKEITNINNDLQKIKNIDINEQRTLHQKISDINKLLTAQLDIQRSTELDIAKNNKLLKSYKEELDHLSSSTCPYCKQSFEDTEEKKSVCIHNMSECEENIIELSDLLVKTDDEIESLTVSLKENKALLLVDNIEELIDIKNKAEHFKEKVIELENAVNPFIEPLQELESEEVDEINMDIVNELTDTITHQKFLLKLLTKKDSFIRKNLLNKNIPLLNSRLSYYITELGLPHVVEFTYEMTAKISQFGRELDFGNLSSGQRARVNIALSLSFRDILQMLHDNINICMFDEVLDVGLDAVGVQHAARILKRKAQDEKLSMFIISHRDEIGNAFDRKMTVQMSRGFSNIKYD